MHPLKKFLEEKHLSYARFVREYKLKLTPQYIRYVALNKRTLSKGTAKLLGRATGIAAEKLMFPENYN